MNHSGNFNKIQNLVLAASILLAVIWAAGWFYARTLQTRVVNPEEFLTNLYRESEADIYGIQKKLTEFNQATKKIIESLDTLDMNRIYQILSKSRQNYEIALYENEKLLVWTDHYESVVTKPDLREVPLGGNLSIWFSDEFVDLSSYEWLDNSRYLRLEVKRRLLRLSDQPGNIYYSEQSDRHGLTFTYGYFFGNTSQLPDYIYAREAESLTGTGANFVMEFRNSEMFQSQPAEAFRNWFGSLFSMLLLVILIFILIRTKEIIHERHHSFIHIAICLIIPVYLQASGLLGNLLMSTASRSGTFQLFSDTYLVQLFVFGIFLFAGALILSNKLLEIKRLYGFTWYPRTISFALVYGLLAGLLHAWLLIYLLNAATSGQFEVLDLAVVPMTETILLYMGGGLLTGALILTVLFAGWFLINTEQDHLYWVHPVVAAGFLYTFSITFWFNPGEFYMKEILFIWYILTFAALYILALVMHFKPGALSHLSPFRIISIGVIITVLFLYPAFFSAVDKKYDEGMLQLAKKTATTGFIPDEPFFLQSPYRLMVFQNDVRTDMSGDYAHGQFPDEKTVPEIYQDLKRDEVAIRRVPGHYFKYREVVYSLEDRVIIVQARLQNLMNHIYSFFRLFFVLMISTLALYLIYQIFSGDSILLFRTRDRFQNRILDAFLLSTFIFLIVVVMVSQRIVHNQSLRNIELELFETLHLLDYNPDTKLDRLSNETGLNYFVYDGIRLIDFSEMSMLDYTLPHPILPWSVYQNIINSNRSEMIHTVKTGSGDVLIGYKRTGNRPSSEQILAIPAVLSSNKYSDQILQSSSMTIVLYLIIFGLFIVGAMIISRQIMRPIHQFRYGLQRISAGNLDTVIPVTTQDEIGELANAYNLMVYKLKDLQDELAEKERHTAWAEMARQVAHEIKNPLTPMKLSVQHLYQQVTFGDKAPEEIKELIKKITQTLVGEIDSLTNIANDFSKFAKPITEDFKPLDLNQIIQSVMDLYRHEKRAYLYFDGSDEPLYIMAAADELKRVFINLVKNAMEALKPGGIILIRAYRFQDQAYVEIVDNGSGIPDDLKGKIFIPNFSTKSTGTGLGLAISRKVIDLHKGYIQFASTRGLGTTFTLGFPLYNGEKTGGESKNKTHAA